MALHQSVLLTKAKKRELQDLAKRKITPASVSTLHQLLNDVYVLRHPTPLDYSNRTDLVRIFNAMAKEIYGNSDDSLVVEGFGSFVMDMFSAESDLDLSLNFSSNAIEVTREKKIKTLRKFAKKLCSLQKGGHVTGIQTIMTARVPIVKVIDCGTRIECDLSVENKDGIAKSQIIHLISAIDERFQKLSFLMKAWAKAHGINSSKDRTLNSLSIISLVAFHLQTRDPPILPPFSTLFKDGTDPANVMKMVQSYLNYGTSNEESLGELFVTLFVKLASVENLWRRGLCASLYEGSWISKAWDSQIGFISVEDFTDRSQNVARAVRTEGVKKIYNCIRRSLHYLLSFLDGQVHGPLLIEHLFGKNVIPTVGNRVTTNTEKNIDNLPVHHDFHHTKPKLIEHLFGKNVIPTVGNRVTTNTEKNIDNLPVHHDFHHTKPKLIEHLFGKDVIPTVGNRVTTNTEKKIDNLPVHHDFHHTKKMRLTDGWRGTQFAEGWESTHFAKGLGGTQHTEGWVQTQSAEGWGGTQLADGRGGTQLADGRGGTELASGWSGTPLGEVRGGIQLAGVWGRKQEANGWEGKQEANGWGGKLPVDGRGGTQKRGTQHTEGWVQTRLADGRGGTQLASGWSGTALGEVGGGIQLAGVWGRKQDANGWGGKLPVDGREGTQQSYGEILSNPSSHLRQQVPYRTPQVASSYNNTVCNGRLKLPSVPIANPMGSERSSVPLLRQSLVSPHNSLSFDVSHNLNPSVPMPYCGPIYSLNQPRSIPRR